jgi:hypothetical protein
MNDLEGLGGRPWRRPPTDSGESPSPGATAGRSSRIQAALPTSRRTPRVFRTTSTTTMMDGDRVVLLARRIRPLGGDHGQSLPWPRSHGGCALKPGPGSVRGGGPGRFSIWRRGTGDDQISALKFIRGTAIVHFPLPRVGGESLPKW